MGGSSAADASTRRAAERLAAIAETVRAFAEATSDYSALLETIAERATSLLGDLCIIAIIDEEHEHLAVTVVAGHDASVVADVRRAMKPTLPLSEVGLVFSVIQSNKPLVVPKIEPSELAASVAPRYADLVRRLGVHAFLAVPLRTNGHAIGGISVYRYAPGRDPLDDGDVAFAQSIADHAALAIINARLVASLRREVAERSRLIEEATTFVSLVENCTDFVGMASFDGRVLFVNAAGRRLVGLGAADASQRVLPDFSPDALGHAAHVHAHGSWRGDSVLRHFETGELIPVRAIVFLVRKADGSPLCLATVQTDLRETKALEARLRHAHKLEAIGQLAGGIAHDLNNLLTIILSYGAIAIESLPERSELREDVEQMELAGHRAAALTRQLLALGRRQVLEPTRLDLNVLLTDVQRLLQKTLPDDVELAFELAADLGLVFADRGQIEQVVLNLVVNARDAMPDGGALTIATAGVDGDPGGAFVALTVSDTGVGFDDVTKARMFDPFFTTKPFGVGTGLGLTTVLEIVRACGGHVSAESHRGSGATFRVLLPRVEDGAPMAAPLEGGQSRVRGGSETILLVEDDEPVRALFRSVLRQAGYAVVDAPNPVAALAIGAEPDLLVTDVVLPKMSGRQLAERLVAMRPGLRVLFVSGYAEDILGRHGVLDPGLALLRKPVTPAMLLRRVREVLDTSGPR